MTDDQLDTIESIDWEPGMGSYIRVRSWPWWSRLAAMLGYRHPGNVTTYNGRSGTVWYDLSTRRRVGTMMEGYLTDAHAMWRADQDRAIREGRPDAS